MSKVKITETILDEMTEEEFDTFMESETFPERLNHLLSEDKEETTEDNSEEVLDETKEESDDNNDTEETEETEEEKPEPDNTENNKEEEEESSKQSDEELIDYKKEYEKLLQPIKANKREFIPKTVEELRQLAQKGIDYTRKTQELSSKRKLVETLELNNVSEQDLNFLIDVHKKDPEAIKQLLRNNNIDPLDLNLEEGTYNPSDNIASEEYVRNVEVINYIKNSPHNEKIQDIITNVWDKQSYDKIKEQPILLSHLLGEVEMGRFDKVQDYIEREKILGATNKSDIERYVELVSDGGLFANTEVANSTVTNTPTPKVAQGNKAGAKPTKSTNSPKKDSGKILTPQEIDKLSDKDYEAYMTKLLE